MTEDWLLQAETICLRCDGRCCVDAHPPVSDPCYERLRGQGVPKEYFDHTGYLHLRSRPDGSCICRENGKCSIHGIKPDTCRAVHV